MRVTYWNCQVSRLTSNLPMEELTPRLIPDSSEPRHCPECGSRVADLASVCLMCGASLDVEEAPAEAPPSPRFQVPWRGLFVSILTVVAFLGLVGWLVRLQIISYSTTPTPAFTPTVTRPPTYTPRPTEKPTSTLTPTAIPPLPYEVRQGETCVGIATQRGISLDTLVDLNPEKCGSDGIIVPGDILLIPAATPTIGPTSTVGPGTPVPTQECPIYHAVQAGETGLGIAERYNVSFSIIEAANPDKDLSQLQPNQVLQIPCGTPAPTPMPTMDPNASPTPVPKYAPPALLSPPDGATLTAEMVPLQWTAVSLLRDDEWYAVRLRRLDADVPVESVYTRTTLERLGEEYAPSPDDPSREYSWEVTVVRLAGASASGEPRYVAASYTSSRRTFRWLAATPEATASSTPVP
jgi:LysM repeat protein